MNNEFMEVLKIIADKRMEVSLDSMFNEDCEYKKMEERAAAMGVAYDSLKLSPELKEVVDDLLAERDGMNIEKVSLAYWAGVKDAIIILKELEIIAL
ncbi:hypothetical protein [Enterocloster citroniae]|uniref:Phage protein n=2 Tax=Enterocloster citroniae TaxID=358743 RepID=A0ABV2G5T0_9FIRM|nr:hypothetical protein [Enterocloster citroniae]KMW17816.1 hypothetical protein HMPREF9470_03505 [[Clostridium] citroniae WAL-19142]